MNQVCSDLETIFSEITAERARQDELHPWEKLKISVCSDRQKFHEKNALYFKGVNDEAESRGYAFIDCLSMEELHEIFAETDPVKQETEAIQLAALAIKFVQWSRAKRAKEG